MASDTEHPREAESKARVFISYSRKDMAFADRLEVALKARGFEPLIDRTGIYAFEDWWRRIETLIAQADTIIFVISPDAVTSDICLKEVEFAALLNKRFAPVVCKRVDDKLVPAPFRRFNYIFCDDDAQFDARINLLAEALETEIEWIRKHTEFGALARKWEIAGSPGPRGLMLRSPTLDEAERWLASRPPHGPEPTPITRAFIVESRRAVKQQKVRAVLTMAAVTLVVGGLVGAWFEKGYLQLRWDLWRSVLSTGAEESLKPQQEFQECSRCPVMVVVPAGEFMMGSPETQKGREVDEFPQHKVTIGKPFSVAKFEVTFDDWDACVELGGCKNYWPGDSGWGRGNRPVIDVNWDDAQQYVAWLSQLAGKRYRLLTEAEYEYATRAGTTTVYPWGDDIGKNNANCFACGSQWDKKQTAPVGSFAPNGFGLFDMVGNVWEWVEDCSHPDYQGAPTDGSAWMSGNCRMRIQRGGAWSFFPQDLRSAHRTGVFTDRRFDFIGFRVGRTLITP
jgi:formylglycine-generating enzyme required for sulfatase activity